MKLRKWLKKIGVIVLCGGMILASGATGVLAALSYVDINGSTIVTDTANQHGWGGAVVLNDCTAQQTKANGIALGWNASGEGIFKQQAETVLNKSSVGPFGSVGGSVYKFSEQKAKVNVAGPIALACADLSQVNKGNLFTVAGPGSTFTQSSDLLKQDMNGGSLGNGGLKLSQYAERSTGWGALATTPNGFTENWGNTYASAKQAKSPTAPWAMSPGATPSASKPSREPTMWLCPGTPLPTASWAPT